MDRRVDQIMDRRTRICIVIILIGLANFLAYVILYSIFWGEAINGFVETDGQQLKYYLQSREEVSRGVFIYSGLHSISIWLTVGAVMLAMLTLAKERIASSMRSAIIRGRTFITILAAVIAVAVIVITILFSLHFFQKLANPSMIAGAGIVMKQ